jgi:RNA recognition motif-containing protein
MSLFIGRLSKYARSDDIREAFEKYGQLERFELKSGYGFVVYASKDLAEAAMNGLQSKDFSGRKIVIEVFVLLYLIFIILVGKKSRGGK